ncbi:membrane-associated sensor domain-containing protein [Shewanella olleyana]|uniref:GGDEF domain-containing protein n=1 Tax=Shewanella olleyana TaxID=135626 RepID=UPI00200C3965|nr:membrane-associated sensor domain-containing protein [Shewanella olleyana]MCL1067479.1 membrane-associated sensor domain-containing protein [Shewanella olleyana]
MLKPTPTFEHQLNFETQQYLAKGCRWFSVLSFVLALVIFFSKLYNNPESNWVFTTFSILPLACVSFYGALNNFLHARNYKIDNFNRYYRFIFALILCWFTVCNMLLLEAISAQSRIEAILHLLIFSLSVALFPKRNIFLFSVALLAGYMTISRAFNSEELFFPIVKMMCFVGVVISGQRVMEKWFRRAVFKDVENQRLLEELNQLALTDGLTKLSNRRHFDLMLKQEIQHSERTAAPMSIILMDIDYFKKLNDHLGHQKGDECLIKLARLLKQQIKRPRDVCARYGGEEFIVLLPETDLSGAVDVANNIKIQLNQLALKHPDSLVSEFITVSQGVAQWHSGMTVEQLVKQADDKLYEVKTNSRNNIAYAL